MVDLALDDRIELDNALEAAIQEIDLVLNTESTELLGDYTFGVTMENFLWTLTPTTESCKTYLEGKLTGLYYLNMFNWKVIVDYLEGEYRSIYHVKILIYVDDINFIKKEYEFR